MADFVADLGLGLEDVKPVGDHLPAWSAPIAFSFGVEGHEAANAGMDAPPLGLAPSVIFS